jgi:hypothetical protein
MFDHLSRRFFPLVQDENRVANNATGLRFCFSALDVCEKSTHPVRGEMFIEVGVRGVAPREGCNVLWRLWKLASLNELAQSASRTSHPWRGAVPNKSPSINIPPLTGWMRQIFSHLLPLGIGGGRQRLPACRLANHPQPAVGELCEFETVSEAGGVSSPKH